MSSEIKERQILVLYGSETGTAQDVAERIGRESSKYHISSKVIEMNDASLQLINNYDIAVFVASTTGQGDDPENMKSFFQNLWGLKMNRKLLYHLKYGVIGLGDSSYQKFNYAAKRLNNLLMYLGATPLLKIGLGDDQHELGPDFIVNSWLKNWWDILIDIFPLPEGYQVLSGIFLEPAKYQVSYIEETCTLKNSPLQEYSSQSYNSQSPFFSKINFNIRKTAEDHFQDVRLIEFDTKDINYDHNPGDVLVMQPQNLKEHVDMFINILGLDPSKKFVLKSENHSIPPPYILPQPCTIRQCIESYFDIQSIPKRYFFEVLSFFTNDEQEKEKFTEFASPEGQEELYNYCNRPKRSIVEVLADFPNTNRNIPFEYLFNIIPPIRPRSYSIASSNIALPGKAQILVAIVKYKTILKKPRIGLCTNWLSGLDKGDIVPIWIKKGSLRFPDPLSPTLSPVIMIGPGTGCAPFRSFIQECCALGVTGFITMIFGCRGKEKDYFFKDEWEQLNDLGKVKIFCAFSRDQEDKIYVQHIMKKEVPYFWKQINDLNAQIYYAGNAKRIPIDVYEALEFICLTGGNMTEEGVKFYMKKNLEKRYQTESWV